MSDHFQRKLLINFLRSQKLKALIWCSSPKRTPTLKKSSSELTLILREKNFSRTPTVPPQKQRHEHKILFESSNKIKMSSSFRINTGRTSSTISKSFSSSAIGQTQQIQPSSSLYRSLPPIASKHAAVGVGCGVAVPLCEQRRLFHRYDDEHHSRRHHHDHHHHHADGARWSPRQQQEQQQQERSRDGQQDSQRQRHHMYSNHWRNNNKSSRNHSNDTTTALQSTHHHHHHHHGGGGRRRISSSTNSNGNRHSHDREHFANNNGNDRRNGHRCNYNGGGRRHAKQPPSSSPLSSSSLSHPTRSSVANAAPTTPMIAATPHHHQSSHHINTITDIHKSTTVIDLLLSRAEEALRHHSPLLSQKLQILKSVCDLIMCLPSPTTTPHPLQSTTTTTTSRFEHLPAHLLVLCLAHLCVHGSGKVRSSAYHTLHYEMGGMVCEPPQFPKDHPSSSSSSSSSAAAAASSYSTSNSGSETTSRNKYTEIAASPKSLSGGGDDAAADGAMAPSPSPSVGAVVTPPPSPPPPSPPPPPQHQYHARFFKWFYPSKYKPHQRFTAGSFEQWTQRMATTARLNIAENNKNKQQQQQQQQQQQPKQQSQNGGGGSEDDGALMEAAAYDVIANFFGLSPAELRRKANVRRNGSEDESRLIIPTSMHDANTTTTLTNKTIASILLGNSNDNDKELPKRDLSVGNTISSSPSCASASALLNQRRTTVADPRPPTPIPIRPTITHVNGTDFFQSRILPAPSSSSTAAITCHHPAALIQKTWEAVAPVALLPMAHIGRVKDSKNSQKFSTDTSSSSGSIIDSHAPTAPSPHRRPPPSDAVVAVPDLWRFGAYSVAKLHNLEASCSLLHRSNNHSLHAHNKVGGREEKKSLAPPATTASSCTYGDDYQANDDTDNGFTFVRSRSELIQCLRHIEAARQCFNWRFRSGTQKTRSSRRSDGSKAPPPFPVYIDTEFTALRFNRELGILQLSFEDYAQLTRCAALSDTSSPPRLDNKSSPRPPSVKVYLIDIQAMHWADEELIMMANQQQSAPIANKSDSISSLPSSSSPLPHVPTATSAFLLHKYLINSPLFMTVIHGGAHDVAMLKGFHGIHSVMKVNIAKKKKKKKKTMLTELGVKAEGMAKNNNGHEEKKQPPKRTARRSKSIRSVHFMNTFYDTAVAESYIQQLIWDKVLERATTQATAMSAIDEPTTSNAHDDVAGVANSTTSKSIDSVVDSAPTSESSASSTVMKSPRAFRDSVGLAALLKRYDCGAEKDMSQQVQEWGMRPLSDEALSYAADDVRHLPTVLKGQLRVLSLLLSSTCCSPISVRSSPTTSESDRHHSQPNKNGEKEEEGDSIVMKLLAESLQIMRANSNARRDRHEQCWDTNRLWRNNGNAIADPSSSSSSLSFLIEDHDLDSQLYVADFILKHQQQSSSSSSTDSSPSPSSSVQPFPSAATSDVIRLLTANAQQEWAQALCDESTASQTSSSSSASGAKTTTLSSSSHHSKAQQQFRSSLSTTLMKLQKNLLEITINQLQKYEDDPNDENWQQQLREPISKSEALSGEKKQKNTSPPLISNTEEGASEAPAGSSSSSSPASARSAIRLLSPTSLRFVMIQSSLLWSPKSIVGELQRTRRRTPPLLLPTPPHPLTPPQLPPAPPLAHSPAPPSLSLGLASVLKACRYKTLSKDLAADVYSGMLLTLSTVEKEVNNEKEIASGRSGGINKNQRKGSAGLGAAGGGEGAREEKNAVKENRKDVFVLSSKMPERHLSPSQRPKGQPSSTRDSSSVAVSGKIGHVNDSSNESGGSCSTGSTTIVGDDDDEKQKQLAHSNLMKEITNRSASSSSSSSAATSGGTATPITTLHTRWPMKDALRLINQNLLPHPADCIRSTTTPAVLVDAVNGSGDDLLFSAIDAPTFLTHPLTLLALARSVHLFVMTFSALLNLPPMVKRVSAGNRSGGFGHGGGGSWSETDTPMGTMMMSHSSLWNDINEEAHHHPHYGGDHNLAMASPSSLRVPSLDHKLIAIAGIGHQDFTVLALKVYEAILRRYALSPSAAVATGPTAIGNHNHRTNDDHDELGTAEQRQSAALDSLFSPEAALLLLNGGGRRRSSSQTNDHRQHQHSHHRQASPFTNVIDYIRREEEEKNKKMGKTNRFEHRHSSSSSPPPTSFESVAASILSHCVCETLQYSHKVLSECSTWQNDQSM